jgi:hypothetical protein
MGFRVRVGRLYCHPGVRSQDPTYSSHYGLVNRRFVRCRLVRCRLVLFVL